MTEVEYTEQALDHLDGLDPQVADRVLNKVEEASGPNTDWNRFRDIRTTSSESATTGRS